MLQQTEVYQLIVAIILAPLIVRSLRSIDLPGTRPIVLGVAAMALAFVFTVVEGFYAPELSNSLEHAMYAVSGIAFLWSAIEGAVYWFGRGGEAR
jgi:hypothetical protein